MRLVLNVYDDNSADIFDTYNYSVKLYTFNKLLEIADDILGVYGNKKENLIVRPVKVIAFPTEDEADEYLHDHIGTKIYEQGNCYVYYEYNKVIHVDYYVFAQAGDEKTYVSDTGYTPYIHVAKSFEKTDAVVKSLAMTKNSRTGKHWSVQRVPCNKRV